LYTVSGLNQRWGGHGRGDPFWTVIIIDIVGSILPNNGYLLCDAVGASDPDNDLMG
jgi:hypothetical protein